MTERRELPYGSWPSPITIDMAVSSQIAFREPRLSGGDVYWTEGRPAELGRQVIVRWSEAAGATDVTPPPYNARTMIHEYGGGWYTVDERDGTVYFSNVSDGRIYRVTRDGAPVALTPDGAHRFGDLVLDAARQRLVCIREDHTHLAAQSDLAANMDRGDGRIAEPRNELVAIDTTSGAVSVLASGRDFYSSPRVAADGQLAWLEWNHPNMPWDASELWVAACASDGALVNPRRVAGGDDESIVQPEWAPDGSLVFVSDRSGWWNLYRWSRADAPPESLAPMAADFAGPQWVFGMSWYGIAGDGTIFAAAAGEAGSGVWRIARDGPPALVDLPDARVETLQVRSVGELTSLCYIGASWEQPRRVVLAGIDTGGRVVSRRVLREQFELTVDRAFLSEPEAIEFPTTDGQTAHAFYYRPTNPDYRAPAGEKPPLVVEIHGGPTSSASTALQMGIDAFTSRGFAVVDVNYRGSNGYGREYMRSLDGKWGVYDVDDCIAAARYLAERGDVDPERMAIRGGSAGGYTTLAALTFHDVFAAGASHYGVGDLEALARFTHKYESHYLDRLVAPYPEGAALYRERSPIHHIDRLSRPLIVLQGVEDKVVPIAQAEEIVDALRRQNVPHAYLPFDGEGHGFRQAHNIRRALEAELSFYAQVFGFELADDFEPIEVALLSDK
jgi:dipeptidyl aminopeptidase/acylaminoacyl peptidase